MCGGFLGISFSPTAALSPETTARLTSIDSNLVGPRRRHWGEARPGANLLIAWERESGIGSSVVETEDSVNVTVGVTSAPDRHGRRAGGVFSGVERTAGRIAAWCDPLAYGTLFRWSGRGISAVGTRPELVAAVAEALVGPLAKRAAASADLAYVGWLNETTMTGWNDIHALPTATAIELVDGAHRLIVDDDAIRWAHEPPEPVELDELVDRAADALLDSLRRILDTPFPVVADLTAGKDSRLVVAGLSALGALDSVPVQTIGGVGLHDVDGAARVAQFVGARHRVGFPYPVSEHDLSTRFANHVANTCGMANPMKGIREQPGRVDEIRICGLVGEVVNGWPTPVSRDVPVRDALPQIARAFQAARVELLVPDAKTDARARLERYLLAPPNDHLSGWFAAHRFYGELRLRGRLSRVGDFVPEVRAYPLYSLALIEAGMACLWQHPDADLATLLAERLAPGITTTETSPRAPVADAVSPPPMSFMQRAAASQVESRQQVFAAIAERESEAWQTIDRSRFRAAVDGYAELEQPQVRLLHGAATAVLWMSEQSPVVLVDD